MCVCSSPTYGGIKKASAGSLLPIMVLILAPTLGQGSLCITSERAPWLWRGLCLVCTTLMGGIHTGRGNLWESGPSLATAVI